jgi:ribonuclease D
MAVLRQLWSARDELARKLDLAPSKVMPDRVLSAIAGYVREDRGPSRAELGRIDGIRRTRVRRYQDVWKRAIDSAMALPAEQLPPMKERSAYSSNPRNWERHNPEKYALWQLVRPAVNDLAESLRLPAENLIAPAELREITWNCPEPTVEAVQRKLTELGSRPWQIEVLAPTLVAAISNPAAAQA